MTARNWMINNNKKRDALLRETPKTREEKDLWNLKWMLYGIEMNSGYYRQGIIGTLRRAIKRLEKEL